MRTRVMVVIRLLQFYITGLVVPILSLLFLDRGLTLSELALSFGFFSASTILLEVPTGVIADLFGRKKTYLLSLVVYILAFVVIYIGRTFVILSVGAVLYGCSRALSSGSLDALFIEEYTKKHGKEKIPRIMSIFTVTETVGLALGSLSGGYLPVVATAFFKSIGKYDLNIFLKIILLLVLIVLVSTLVYERKTVKSDKSRLKLHLLESAQLVQKSHNLKLIFISFIATGIFLSTLELYWQPRFLSLLKNDSMIWLLGFIALLYFGAVLFGSLVSEKVLARFGFSYKHVYFVSKLLSGIAILILALQISAWPFTVCYALVYLFFGASHIPEGTIVNMEITDDKRASMLSLNSLVFQIGGLIGSVASGIIVKFSSVSVLWIIAACVVLLSSIAIMGIKHPHGTTQATAEKAE